MPDHHLVSGLRNRAAAVVGALQPAARHLRRFLERCQQLVEPARRILDRVLPRLRQPALVLGLAVLATGGAWVGIAVLGQTARQVGPVETTMRLVPSWGGESVLSLPPLGTLELDTHDGPVQLHVNIDSINQAAAERIFEDPAVLDGLEEQVVRDIRTGVYATAAKSLITGTLGAMMVTLIVARRRVPTLIASGGAAVGILAVFGVASATLDPRAVTEPKYTGLLTSAPSLIGNAQDIAQNFGAYSEELVRLVTNVTQLYDVTSTLPAYEPNKNVIRVLHVSDLHLGEHAWDIIGSVTRQYSIDLIVDSGDITDHGLAAENYFLQRIAALRVPYVWVRGNHDSLVTQEAMEQIPNVVVLDGKVKTVKGIRFLGAGDPRFTPAWRREIPPEDAQAVARQALALSKVAKNSRPAVDAIVFHDSTGAPFFDGLGLTSAHRARARTPQPRPPEGQPAHAGGHDRWGGLPCAQVRQAAAGRAVRALSRPDYARTPGVGRDQPRRAGPDLGQNRPAPGETRRRADIAAEPHSHAVGPGPCDPALHPDDHAASRTVIDQPVVVRYGGTRRERLATNAAGGLAGTTMTRRGRWRCDGGLGLVWSGRWGTRRLGRSLTAEIRCT